jgi:hypothetical protein
MNKNKRGGFLSTIFSLSRKAVKLANKKPVVPCNQKEQFIKLNERIKKNLESDEAENIMIKKDNFERVIISGKIFSLSPLPLMKGKWQLKIVKLNNIVKYIVVINENIINFNKYCKYQSVIHNISKEEQIEIICINNNGDKYKDIIPNNMINSDKFIFHEFRNNKEGVIAFVAEFI